MESILDVIGKIPKKYEVYRFSPPTIEGLDRNDRAANLLTSDGRKKFWKQLTCEAPVVDGVDNEDGVLRLNPSGHTNKTFFEKGKTITSHTVAWLRKTTESIGLSGLDKNSVDLLSKLITTGINYLYNKTVELPVVFCLTGFGEREAGQSNPLIHWQEVVIPNTDKSQKIPLEELDKIKYFSPMSLLFKDIFQGLVTNLASSESKAITISEAVDENNPLAVGINLKLTDSNKLEDYLDTFYKLEGKLNYVYKLVVTSYEKIYCSNSREETKIMTSTIDKLVNLGISMELAQQIFDKGKLFKPTLSQIDDWLGKDDLDDKVRLELTDIKTKYERIREKNILKNGSTIFRKLVNDQLEPGYVKGGHYALLPNNLSMKAILSYLEDEPFNRDGYLFNGLDIYLLMFAYKGGNTIENKARAFLVRD